MIKAILLDFDGVLVNSMSYHVRAWQMIFQDLNIAVQPDDVLLTEGCRSIELARQVLKRHSVNLSASEVDDLVDRKQNLYRKITRAELIPAARPFLEGARELGVLRGLVTGTPRLNVNKMLSSDVQGLFDVIITGDDVENGKPDPEGYRLAARELRVEPSACLVVENAPLGIKAAKRAGMRVAALATTLRRSYLQEADFHAADLAKLANKLPGLLNSLAQVTATENDLCRQ